MEEETLKTLDSANKESEDFKANNNGRMELYMKITAISSSLVVIAIIFLLIYFIRNIMAFFALAFIITYILSPAIRFFEKLHVNRLLVLSLLYVVFVACVVLSITFLLPMLWNEIKELQTGIQASLGDPEFGRNISEKLDEISLKINRAFPMLKNVDIGEQLDIDKGLSGAVSWILNYTGQFLKTITTYSGKVIWFIILVVLMPFVTFFLLKDSEVIKHSVLRIIPSRYSDTCSDLFQKIDRQIGRYIRGRLAESIILSILTIIGLRILGIRYYLVIGSIAGFANLIPYIGPVMIGIPPVLLAGYQYGFPHMVVTGLFLGGLQVIDNAILIPLIVGKSVDLHPVATMFIVFVGGQLLGLLGMIIAVPLASIIIVITKALYKEFVGCSDSA